MGFGSPSYYFWARAGVSFVWFYPLTHKIPLSFLLQHSWPHEKKALFFSFFFGESLPHKYSHSLTTCTMCVLNKSLLSHRAWGVLDSLFLCHFSVCSFPFPVFVSPHLLLFSFCLIESLIIYSKHFRRPPCAQTHTPFAFSSKYLRAGGWPRWPLQRPDPLSQAQASLAIRHWCMGHFDRGTRAKEKPNQLRIIVQFKATPVS